VSATEVRHEPRLDPAHSQMGANSGTGGAVNTERQFRRKCFARAFGAILREHRVRIEISQEEFAFRGEFDRTFPSLLERGLRTPTITVFCVIAEVLEVHAGELIAETVERVRKMEGQQ
jgi:ribosome-binding protein aMBF1 (putative translation factor)